MQVDETCKTLCSTESIPSDDVKFINERIVEGYAHNWAVDGLPAATEEIDPQTGETYYTIGFKMGSVVDKVPYINNHFEFTIHYHVTSRGLSRVVGVSVIPSSKSTIDDNCSSQDSLHLGADGRTGVTYTYSVKWIVSIHSNRQAIIFISSLCSLLTLCGLHDGMAICMSWIRLFIGFH